MKYKAVLFDMDGTVMDTLEDMKDSVNAALQAFSLPEISLEETRRFVGNGARRLIEQAVPAGTEPELTEQVLSWYLPYYSSHCMIKTGPYAGIPELLRQLKRDGVKIAIVSNKPASATAEITDRYFSDTADYSIGERPGIRRKPWPDMVNIAAEQIGVEKAECVYVGDSEVDVMTARNAGMHCISVLWGFRSREELSAAGAECFAEGAERLYGLISGREITDMG